MVGWQVNADHVMPKLERIDPMAGLKKLFSVRSLVETGKALLVAGVVGWFVWDAVVEAGPDVLRAVWKPGAPGLEQGLSRVGALALRLAWVLVVLGGADLALARRKHVKDLMMTREEVKREHKESEGDPHHKGQRRAAHRQLAAGGPARGVRKASVMVVNPTHIAVALRYSTGECEAPYLVAKGREADALRLRREAEQLGIPVVRDVSAGAQPHPLRRRTRKSPKSSIKRPRRCCAWRGKQRRGWTCTEAVAMKRWEKACRGPVESSDGCSPWRWPRCSAR